MLPLTHKTLRSLGLVFLALLTALLVAQLSQAGGPASYDAQGLKTWLQQVPTWSFCILFFVAPLLAAPLSLLLISAGLVLPLPAAATLTLVTLLIHHALVFSFKESPVILKFQDALRNKKFLPAKTQQRSLLDDFLLIMIATWLPGFSYIIKIAVAAMAGISLNRFLIIGVGAQFTHALPFLVIGELLDKGQLWWLSLVFIVLVLGTWIVRRSLARKQAASEELIKRKA